MLGTKARPLCEGYAGRCHVLHKPCAQGLQGKVCVCLRCKAACLYVSKMAYRSFSHLPYCLIFRGKMHVDWVNAYVSIWTELQAYIKQHHTTGLSWSKTVSHVLVCSVCPTCFYELISQIFKHFGFTGSGCFSLWRRPERRSTSPTSPRSSSTPHGLGQIIRWRLWSNQSQCSLCLHQHGS